MLFTALLRLPPGDEDEEREKDEGVEEEGSKDAKEKGVDGVASKEVGLDKEHVSKETSARTVLPSKIYVFCKYALATLRVPPLLLTSLLSCWLMIPHDRN
jgi:hypothetical protein